MCGTCIEGRDHHCGFFGVGIGDDNRAPFILVCVLAIIAFAADTVMLWPRVLAKLGDVKLQLAELVGARGSAGFPAAGNATAARVRWDAHFWRMCSSEHYETGRSRRQLGSG